MVVTFMRRVSWLTSLAPPAYGRRRNRSGGRASHNDYIRHGTTTLFAALNVLDGSVIGQCMARHRHQEFIRFLNAVERTVPAGKLIHAILDNYAAHKHPKVRTWLTRHPRRTLHFTPTACSWINAVETFFATLTRRRLPRGYRPRRADSRALEQAANVGTPGSAGRRRRAGATVEDSVNRAAALSAGPVGADLASADRFDSQAEPS
jgi:transposase